MVVRLVKMTFKKEEVDTFLEELNKRKERIRNFEGCTFLEVWQDLHRPHIIFSHSHWDDEAALDKYRYSDFFKETWEFTKARFAAPAEAWTVDRIHQL